MNEHTCLVCGYSNDVDFYPSDYRICGCCGTEFGYDDRVLTHEELTIRWIVNGFQWFDNTEPQPAGWDPVVQLWSTGHFKELQTTGHVVIIEATPAVTAVTVAAPSPDVWLFNGPQVEYEIQRDAA